MTKFKYPTTGLYGPCKIHLDGATTKIKSAISTCSLSVPATFSHSSYLSNLKSSLNSLNNELNLIQRLLKKDDSMYKLMSQEIEINMAKIEFKTIRERERMIK